MKNPLYDLIRKNADPQKGYVHVIGFKFPENVSDEEQAALMEKCAALGEVCGGKNAGIIHFSVAQNIDPRKRHTWVEFAYFKDPQAFIDFHSHPAHQRFAEEMAKVADVWVVLDISLDW